MRGWLAIATSGPVVRRALCYAIVVGAILAAINHGPAILDGEFGRNRAFQVGLTILVPYAVSTLSSVQAIRSIDRHSKS